MITWPKWAELSLLPEQRELHILIRFTEEWFYIRRGKKLSGFWRRERGRLARERAKFHETKSSYLAGSFISNGYMELRIN